jgi:DNA-binding beta-propeller fold protein YncE
MSQIDRRTFILGGVALALPLSGCGGGVDLPTIASQSAPLAMNKSGSQFMVKPLAHSLVITDSKGATNTIGGIGQGTGQFNYPADVAVLGELAYVVETGNHRIQIFDGTGKSVGVMGEDVLNYPGGIITTADEILVSDSRNARIVGFDTTGRVTRTIGEGTLSAPRGLAVVPDGLLIADPGLRKVLQVDMNGRKTGEFGTDWVLPWDVATDGTLVFVADVSTNEVAVLSTTGERVDRIALDSAPQYLSFRDSKLYIVH